MKPNKGESKQDFLNRCMDGKAADDENAFAACNIEWDNSRNQRSVLTFSRPLEFTAAAGDDKKRSFLITAYTGAEIERWFGTMVIDIEGMKTKEKIPVLREHQRDRVVGFGQSFNDGNNFFIKGDFSKSTGDAREVLDLADEGYPWQASVGIWPGKIEILEGKKNKATVNGKEITGPAEIWRESDVGEVSFVSLGADDDTAAISMTESKSKVAVTFINPVKDGKNKKNGGTKKMDLTLEALTKDAPDLLAKIQGDAEKAGINIGVDQERARVGEILSAGAGAEVTKKAIMDGTDAGAAFKLFFEAEVQKKKKGLDDLENDATESVGTETGDESEGVDMEGKPDEIVARKASELRLKDRGLSMEEALRRVLAENPKLAKQYRESFAV